MMRRVLALGAYFSMLLLLGGLLFAQRVSAELREHGLELGRELDGFEGLSGDRTEVELNGQSMTISALVLEQPVEQVLEQFISICNRELGNVPDTLSRSLHRGNAAPLLERLLVMRDLHDDGTGIGVCLAGLGKDGLAELFERTQRFVRTHDVGELGKLRYAHMRSVGANQTRVILVRADDSMNLDELVPAEGDDAPGEDLMDARPPDSTRVLSASTRGLPYRVNGYHSALPAMQAFTEFARSIEGRGFKRVERRNEGGAQTIGVTFRSDDGTFIVTGHDDGEGSNFSVVQLSEDGTVEIDPLRAAVP